MTNNLPAWLNQWLKVSDNEENLSINFQEEEENHVAVVEATWVGEKTSVSDVLMNMEITDPTIEMVYKPHLSPESDMTIGDLAFRAPAIIFENDDQQFALIPDLDFIDDKRDAPHIMDYIKAGQQMYYGLSHYQKRGHVYYEKTDRAFEVDKNQLLFRFYLVQWNKGSERRDFRPVNDFIWERFAEKRMKLDDSKDLVESITHLEKHAEYTYDWAFNRWEDVVWQEFELNQQKVGSPVFIVRADQTPGRGQEDQWREKKSIWNQAWFSSIRSAYGYRIWGEKWGNEELIKRSDLAKNFALAAPQKDGLFPAVFTADNDQQWEDGTWGHSDRRPFHHEEYYHLLDMSWTTIWMLRWYENIEADQALLDYSITYAERLLKLQADDGSFPGWVHEETGEISPYLEKSPETSMHVWFLTNLYQITMEEKYLTSAKAGMAFVVDDVIPTGRWEDFETYWSCAREWEQKQYGKKDERSGIYNQCTFSIYWTAEALKELYKVTKEASYLESGESLLAELSLYQAVWNPEFLFVPVLGGFGVMNSDDEWNDSRQSLIALTYAEYYQLTDKDEYKYRSIWAMRASFYMMYSPENKVVKDLYEKTFPVFGEQDYGFLMENVHHGEFGSYEHVEIGEFTIFDWGNGAASTSLGMLLLNK